MAEDVKDGDVGIDQQAHALLAKLAGPGELDIFPETASASADDISQAHGAAARLVALRFAKYADEGRTRIAITNPGRYWAANGGYMAFLKEDPDAASRGGGRQRNPEMEALRAEYMKLRLGTFWWTFGLSIAGFVISIISVIIAILYGDRVLR